MKAHLVRKNDFFILSPGIKLPLVAKLSSTINMQIDGEHSQSIKDAIEELVQEYTYIFQPLSPGYKVYVAIKQTTKGFEEGKVTVITKSGKAFISRI